MKPNEITERLVPNPSEIPDVRILVGFLGKTTKEGYWRLYLSLDLKEYVEFRQEDVAHSEQLEREDSPLGGTAVWIKRDANLQHTRITSREAQADFLQGRVRACLRRRMPPTIPPTGILVPQPVPWSASFHFNFICDRLAAPTFLTGGDVFDCDPSVTWTAECQ